MEIYLRYRQGGRICPSLLTWEVHHCGKVQYPHIAVGDEAEAAYRFAQQWIPEMLLLEAPATDKGAQLPEFNNRL